MLFVIALIGTALALIQNLVVLAMGMKEGTLWYAPLSFGGILLAEVAAVWAAYIGTRKLVHSRRALVLAAVTAGVLALAELALPYSAFKVYAQKAHRERILGRIERGGDRIELLSSAPGRRRFALTYTLTFPNR